MANLTNSRFITYPTILDKSSNHTLAVVDATDDDIQNLGLFCSASNKNYDIYLYNGSVDDLEWLNAISNLSEKVLIKLDSHVTITNTVKISSQDLLKYFEEVDAK